MTNRFYAFYLTNLMLGGLFFSGFQDLLLGPSGNDSDLFGFGFFTFCDDDSQQAIFKFRVDVLRVRSGRQGERAGKAPVVALESVKIFSLLLGFKLALAADGEHVVFDVEVNVFLLHTWDLGLQRDLVLVFIDVHWRNKVRESKLLFRAVAKAENVLIIEELVHPVL